MEPRSPRTRSPHPPSPTNPAPIDGGRGSRSRSDPACLTSHAPADPVDSARPPRTTLIPSPSTSRRHPDARFSSPSAVCASGRRRHLPSPRPSLLSVRLLLSDSSAATPGLEPLADRAPPRPSLLSVRRLLSDSSSAAPPGREPIVDRRASRSWGASNRSPLLRGPLPPSSSPGAYLRPSSSAAAGD